jgi:hypothetical protein
MADASPATDLSVRPPFADLAVAMAPASMKTDVPDSAIAIAGTPAPRRPVRTGWMAWPWERRAGGPGLDGPGRKVKDNAPPGTGNPPLRTTP